MNQSKIRFSMLALIAMLTLPVLSASVYGASEETTLPDGQQFKSWEASVQYKKIYYVDCNNPVATDSNDGSEARPFKTIQAAADRLKPGEKVVIRQGVYREKITPARGGENPRKMISYEAYPGDTVVISGSVEVPSEMFRESEGWYFPSTDGSKMNVWQIDLAPEWFVGYNPFGMTNLLGDLTWLEYKRAKMDSHFKRRGMLFVDGEMAPQVLTPKLLAESGKFAYWIEHNGLRLHVNLPAGTTPADYNFEATNLEQVFAPKEYGLGYIRLAGLTFRHSGNGFPVPQRGMVSANRGHHWIIEDCTLEWANSVGLDMGNECWGAKYRPVHANHIVRRNVIRNCGISGFQCYIAKNVLMEDNLFDNIGWHDAEHAFESAGVKFHHAENCLIRRNMFNNIKHAPGLWLDNMSNKNCRVTSNFFNDVTTARGAIYVEVSRDNCIIDHNLIRKTRCQWWLSGDYGAGGSGLYTDGSDSIKFVNNMVIDAENTGYGSYLNAERIIEMRGGITCDHVLAHNIFVDCGKHCIEFPNTRNKSDFNIFVNPKPGYIRLGNPSPALKLDAEAANKLYEWDGNSEVINKKFNYVYDEATRQLNIVIEEDLPFDAGPFKLVKGNNIINADPRKLR